MADCVQYDSDYIHSIDKNSMGLDINFVEAIINQDYNLDKVEGVWYPIVITSSDNQAEYCDLLHKSKETIDNFDKYYANIYGKDKCQSSDVGSFNILSIGDNIVASRSRFFDGEDVEYIYNALDCLYCGSYSKSWQLIDKDGNTSDEYAADCCGGACDVRMNENDYIPKIPLLNQHYYTEPCDFQYIADNPARSGPGLGKEQVVQVDGVDDLSFAGDIKLYVDWKLKETISEIPYDQATTQHANKNLHDKSYKKAKIISRTCGNFLLNSINENTKYNGYDYSWLEDNIEDIPKPEDFTQPYGIRGSTIDNIFVGAKKIGSFWKWNYTSGILGWYRKYDVNRVSDQRPISGVDLYLADGDVFFATNAKIEPDPAEESDLSFIKSCPSGLKIVQAGVFKGIIPNESSFIYISANIYDLFYEWYERYQAAGHSLLESKRLAAIMATAPQFENVTTDLLDPILGSKDSSDYALNSLQQIKVLSENLQTGTNYDSIRINYVSNEKDLFNILEYKYGAYLGIKKNATITFDSPVDNNFVLDLNFDFVTKSTNNDTSYEQNITVGDIELLSVAGQSLTVNGITYTADRPYTLYDVYPRIVDSSNFNGTYCDDCDAYSSFYLTSDGEAACINDGDASFCYDTLSFFLNNSQGQDEGTRPQRLISDATLRESRPVNFYHPYVDIFAINSKKSMYISSAMHDIPIGITSANSLRCPANELLNLQFIIDAHSMIKLYWSNLNQVQNQKCSENKRFPLDLNNLCKCYTNNSYIPNVSTSISPILNKNGGYNQSQLDSIFGAGVVSAGGTVSSCDRSDPLAENDCIRQTSVSIPNYVHSIWDLKISNGTPDLISVHENINTNVSPWKLDTSVNYVKYNPRQEWKRFATKVKIENKIPNGISPISEVSLYSEQEKIMPVDAQQQGYKLTLTNPFLAALIGNDEFIENISFPGELNCTNYQGLSGLTDIRGDEVSVVNLTFTSKPKKTLLNFYFHGMNQQVIDTYKLNEAQFDPNNGLMDGTTYFDPIIRDNIFDYDREINIEEDIDPAAQEDVKIYYGDINANFDTVYRNLTDFNIDKKVKIYYQAPGGWYATSLNKGTGFFEHLDYKFVGKPHIFEYIDNEYNSSLYPSVLPSVSKTHKWFMAESIFGSNYPYLKTQVKPQLASNRRDLRLEGTRYYFQIFPSIKIASFVLADTDENNETISTSPGELQDLITNQDSLQGYYLSGESTENGDPIRTDYDILTQNNYFIKIDNVYYKKIGTGFAEDVFLKLEGGRSDFKKFLPYNDTHLDLQNIEETGYVLNSNTECDQSVELKYVDIKGLEQTVSNKIIRKTLQWKFYDKDGFETYKSNSVTSKLYTYFLLEKALQSTNKLSMIFGGKSFIVYDDTPGLSEESSEYLNNSTFKTKWGDIRGYDYSILDEFINHQKFFLDILHQPIYKNWFYKHFINYILRETGENLFLKTEYAGAEYPQIHKIGTADTMGTILQKYNLFDGPYHENISWQNIQNYQNFIPVMDIAIDKSIELGNYTSLNFTSSSLIIPYYSSDALAPGDKFWIVGSTSTSSYVPNSDYSPTLRIDGPFNRLKNIRTTNNYDDDGYRKAFIANTDMWPIRSTVMSYYTISDDDEPFKNFIIYGDLDQPKCEAQVDQDKRGFCLLDNIGSGSIYAAYTIFTGFGNTINNPTMNNKPYLLSYDCGEYNPIGLPQLVTIQKSKLPYDSYTSPSKDNDTQYLKPFNDLPNIIDLNYQHDINSNIVSNDSQDDNANEILFRILYGSNDFINRDFFGESNVKILNKIDLINYSDPEITPRDLYDQILYNYDQDATFSNFTFDANITVKDILKVGFEYVLGINNDQLVIRIEQDSIKNVIEANISFKNQNYKKTLFELKNVNHSYISVEAGGSAPSAPNSNTTITLVKTIKYLPARMILPLGARYRTGDVAIRSTIGRSGRSFAVGMTIMCDGVEPPTRPFYPLQDKSEDLGGGKISNSKYYLTRTPVNNLLGGGVGMQAVLNLIPGPWRWSEFSDPIATTPVELANLSYGYCRRKMDCEEPEPEDPDKSIKENFTYKYEIGRHEFDLYGYAYMHTPLIEQQDDDDDDDEEQASSNVCFDTWNRNSSPIGYCPPDNQISYANANQGNTMYGKVYYEMQTPRPAEDPIYGIGGPLDGINVRGDFVRCYEPQQDRDVNLTYLEPECVPFSDDTKWGLGYAINKPMFGFEFPYGERWATGILYLQTLDPNTNEFWDFWENNELSRKDSEKPYHFSNSLCTDDASLDFFKSMEHFPVIIDSVSNLDTPRIRTAILENLNNYDYKIAEWLVANGTTKADKGLAMNYGDEGVDYCGYLDQTVDINDIDLYYQTTFIDNIYNPQFGDVIQIQLTNTQIIVNIQGQTICIDNTLTQCPTVNLPTQKSPGESVYIINDSGCDQCDNSNLKITVNPSSATSFRTIIENRSYTIATIAGTDLNDSFHGTMAGIGGGGGAGGVRFVGKVDQEWGAKRSRASNFGIGDGEFDVVCGETPGNPWYSHRYIMNMDGMGTFETKARIWQENIRNLFNQDDYADTQVMNDEQIFRDGISNLKSIIADVAKVRRTNRANTHIKESDIIHGVVPGSISDIQIKVKDENYTKFRRTTGLNIETGTGAVRTYTAYVTYRYVRPYTLQDAIKESRLGFTDDSFVNQAFDLDFPLWYGQSLGINVSNENILNTPPTKNYIDTNFTFGYSEGACAGFECNYNRYDSNFYRGAPCPTEDHYCWSISSWNGAR